MVEVLWRLATMQQWVGFEVKMFAGQKTQSRIYVNFVLRYKTLNYSKYFADKIVTHLMVTNNLTKSFTAF